MPTQPSVFSVSVERNPSLAGGMRILWDFDRSVPVTSFTLTKSTDKGLAYAALDVVSFDINGAAYLPGKKRFHYDDVAGDSGHLYKVIASGPYGAAAAVIGVAPPQAPSKCLVIGYLLDGVGNVDTQSPVIVETHGTNGSYWTNNPSGVVAQNAQAQGIGYSRYEIYPDQTGLWQIPLVIGTVARVQIPSQELDWAFEVPNQEGPVNIRDLPLLSMADYFSLYPDRSGTRAGLVNS